MSLKFQKVSFNFMPSDIQQLSVSESNVKDYWDILVRRKWVIISFCVLSTLIVGTLSFLTTPLYKASATIVVEQEDSDILNPTANSEKGMSFDIFENYLQTQMSLILSRSVAGKVFDELDLNSDPRYQGETNPIKLYVQKKMSELFSFFALEDNGNRDKKADPLYYFLKDIQLERLKGTRAIKISVFHPNSETAARIANALAERYSRDNLMRRAMTFIRNQRMASLNADYLRLQSRYDYLSNQYGPKHVEMIALKKEIRSLSKRIEAEQAKNNALFSPEAESPFGNASQEEEERMLSDILNNIQESSVLSSSQMNNIAIVDPAVPPTEIAVPHKKRNILIAFLAGLLVGIFLAFFIDYLDDTLKNENDLKKSIGRVNFIGTIPYEENAKGIRRLSKIDSLVMHRPLSESAEAYRLLRVQIHWFMQKKPFFKDLAMVSSIPDEGKSTISSNLAIALSQLNQKVLLVDADIRRGRLSRTYSSGKKKGLTQYLTENIDLDEVIQRTKIQNLSVVTRGENIIKGSELLSTPKMSQFIKETRERFDLIIYDTPPITLVADTVVLLSQLHGAILVARTRVTRTRIVPKALRMIHDTRTNLVGVVLNSTNGVHNKYYHRYYRD